MTMPTGYVLGDISNQSGLFFRSGGGIYLCHDDVAARSSSLSLQPRRLLHFSIAEPKAPPPLRHKPAPEPPVQNVTACVIPPGLNIKSPSHASTRPRET